jgi:hypothetical protein
LTPVNTSVTWCLQASNCRAVFDWWCICREVFGDSVEIYLCIWHVLRCWLDHLLKKVRVPHLVAEMFQALRSIMLFREAMPIGDLVEIIQRMLENFYHTYAAQNQFLDYFKRTWHGRAGMSRMCPDAFVCTINLYCWPIVLDKLR